MSTPTLIDQILDRGDEPLEVAADLLEGALTRPGDLDFAALCRAAAATGRLLALWAPLFRALDVVRGVDIDLMERALDEGWAASSPAEARTLLAYRSGGLEAVQALLDAERRAAVDEVTAHAEV